MFEHNYRHIQTTDIRSDCINTTNEVQVSPDIEQLILELIALINIIINVHQSFKTDKTNK